MVGEGSSVPHIRPLSHYLSCNHIHSTRPCLYSYVVGPLQTTTFLFLSILNHILYRLSFIGIRCREQNTLSYEYLLISIDRSKVDLKTKGFFICRQSEYVVIDVSHLYKILMWLILFQYDKVLVVLDCYLILKGFCSREISLIREYCNTLNINIIEILIMTFVMMALTWIRLYSQ